MMEKVKKLTDLGVSIPSAIKEALGMSLSQFAERYEVPVTVVSDVINGGRRPTDRHLAALIAELGGTEQEWRELLWLAGKPESPSAA